MDNDQDDVNQFEANPDPEQDSQPFDSTTTTHSNRARNSSWRMLQTVVSAAFLVATLFIIWSPGRLGSASLEQRVSDVINTQVPQSTATLAPEATLDPATAKRIGLVVGHLGNDSGAVCSDGLREVDVNLSIATYVQKRMIDLGYEVVLLDEFDDRLDNFKGAILLSIHADSCVYINDYATGFKVAAALSESQFNNSTRLVNCISERYNEKTGMVFHYESVTVDMTYYHAFDEINPQTTAAIIETGFMNLDRLMLTEKAELLAEGIVAGLNCYLNNEPIQPTGSTTTTP